MTACCPQALRLQTRKHQKVMKRLPMTSPPANQEKAPEQITHAITPLNLVFPAKAFREREPFKQARPALASLLSACNPGFLSFPTARGRWAGFTVPGPESPAGSEAAHQGSLGRTRSTAAPRRLTPYECNKRRRMPAGESGQRPQLRRWNSQGNKTRYRKRGERGSRGTHDPESWRGVRPTHPRPCT